jgi:hypothetical protein
MTTYVPIYSKWLKVYFKSFGIFVVTWYHKNTKWRHNTYTQGPQNMAIKNTKNFVCHGHSKYIQIEIFVRQSTIWQPWHWLQPLAPFLINFKTNFHPLSRNYKLSSFTFRMTAGPNWCTAVMAKFLLSSTRTNQFFVKKPKLYNIW